MECDSCPERYTRERRGSIYQTVRVGSFEDRGKREKMEDVHGHTLWEAISMGSNCSYDASGPLCKRIKTEVDAFNTKVSFFLVCDGHGGKSAADFVYDKLFANILGQEDFISDPVDAIKTAFKEIDEEYLKIAVENDLEAGTTVTMIMIVGSTLYVANAGDSDAVLCTNGKACVITEQHTLANPNEKIRIEKLGGRVVGTPTHFRLGHPVLNASLINIGVTRSIGDPWFKTKEWVKEKNSGLIAEPFVNVRQLTSEDLFLIVASDGFWETMSYDQVVNYVLLRMKTTDCNTLCQELVALSKKTARDNITVVLIKFKDIGSLVEES